MPASTPDPLSLAAGGEFVVEAPSVEAAVADVRARTGQEPQILDVHQVARGGVAGFFAREVTQVRVRVGAVAPSESDGPLRRARPVPAESSASPTTGNAVERMATAQIHGVEAVLAAMTADADEREVSFGDVLRRELDEGRDPLRAARAVATGTDSLFASHPALAGGAVVLGSPVAERPAASAAPDVGAPLEQQWSVAVASAEAVVEPVVEPELEADVEADVEAVVAPVEVGPAWSTAALYRLGLPTSLLDRIAIASGVTADGAWLAAVARAVAPLCAPLPQGSQVLVGPDADLLGQALSVPVTPSGGNPPYRGDIALVVDDTPAELAWVDRVTGDRWRHVVVSDRAARGLVTDDVAAVSWVGSRCLPEAIGVAVTCGLVLAYGLRGVGSDVVRATPLDVAIGLRDLLPRAEHGQQARR